VPVRDPSGAITSISDGLCTQCHTAFGEPGATTSAAGLSAHTHHAPDSPGSRCVECHMSDVNWRLLLRRRDHTFTPPVPELTARYGVPNACTTCHDDRSPEWAVRVMDRWYGDTARRRAEVEIGDAMYLAGAGDPAALPGLARLSVDRSRGVLLRASAAGYIGRLLAAVGTIDTGTAGAVVDARGASQTGFVDASRRAGDRPAPRDLAVPGGTRPADAPIRLDAAARTRFVNALIGAASDPEPIVRAEAVKSLGFAGDPRAIAPLGARLVDTSRVVRVRAAEAMLGLGVVVLDDRAGDALARAQAEYAASLRTFPDLSADHTSLAWLELSLGLTDEAASELAAAIRLDPADPRPLVYRGVIAARAERYEDAIRDWRAAQDLDPAYPNLDRLIAEGRKRLRERIP